MTDRTMYDAVDPGNIPLDAELVAGYVNGHYAWGGHAWSRWPRQREVHIDVIGNFAYDADVLDIENGDAGPGQAKAWIIERVKHGRACLYFDRASLAAVAEAVHGLPAVDVWVADWTQEPHRVAVPANMHLVAVQYANDLKHAVDLSVVYDPVWPWGEK